MGGSSQFVTVAGKKQPRLHTQHWSNVDCGLNNILNLNWWIAQNVKQDLQKNNNHMINDIKQYK